MNTLGLAWLYKYSIDEDGTSRPAIWHAYNSNFSLCILEKGSAFNFLKQNLDKVQTLSSNFQLFKSSLNSLYNLYILTLYL